MEKGGGCSRGQYGKYLLTISVLFLFMLQLPAAAQTGLSTKEKFEEGERLFYLNETDRAEALFADIMDSLCKNESLYLECVEAQMLLAVIKRNERDFKYAEKLLNEAQKFIRENLYEEHPVNLELHTEFAYLHEEAGDIKKAEDWLKKAFELADLPVMEGKPRARAYLAQGYIEDTKGNYQTAVDAYLKALFAVENEPRDVSVLRILSKVHNNVSISYRRLGKVNQAMSHSQLVLQVANEAYGDEHVEMGFAFNSMGTVYYSTGDYGTAAQYFLQSANIFKNNYGENHRRLAAALNNAGLCYFSLEDFGKAAEYLEQAQQIKINTLGRDHPETAIGYSNLGSIHLKNEDLVKAQNSYELSIEVRQKIYGGNHPGLTDPLIQLGKLHIKNKNHTTGREYLNRALNIALGRMGENHPVVAEAYYEVGNSHQDEGESIKAAELYSNVLNLLYGSSFNLSEDVFETGSVSDPLLLVNTLKAMADLYLVEYKKEKSLASLHQALEYYRYVAGVTDELQTSYQSEASKLNLIEKNYSIYTKAIEALYILYRETDNPEWLDEIFVTVEKSKSRIALELFQNAEAKTFGGVPRQILEEEQELNTNVTYYYQQLHVEKEKGLDADEEIIKAYQDSLFHTRREINRFTENLEENYPSYYILKYDRNLSGKEETAAFLSQDETLISYIIGEENIYAMVMDNEHASILDLGEKDGLSGQINGIKRAVVSGNSQLYKENAQLLYQKLLAPFADRIHTGELIIVPDQILHYLPFEMLLTNTAEDTGYHELPYLIKDYQIKYAPSATMLRVMSNQKPDNPRNLLALAPFQEGAVQAEEGDGMERYLMDLSSLPLTRHETSEIQKLFNEKRSLKDYFFPEKTELLLGGQATKAELMNSALGEYGYIHFATHAFVHETNPDLSGIALYGGIDNDGIVYVNDIYNLQMNADLVVLGACETGLGTIFRGEGIIGFTRAFIHAGAANLVVSMWRVNDQPTAKLMIGFYKNIQEGLSYSESLQKAKLELINNPEMAAPRNWAAFILNGR